MPRSRLTVGTILREPVETVMRFVAWYLAQDADRVVMCFDDPEDPAIDLLGNVERIECIRCTPEFWERLGISPEARFTKRQNRAMGYVYATIADGWFLNVDSDELLHLDGRTLAEEVGGQGRDIRAIRVEPVEHLNTPDSDGMHFRCLMRPWMQRKVYGDLAPVMKPRQGLMGHTLGKSVTRAGLRDVVVRQHWVQTADGEALTDLTLGVGEGAYLMHFVDQGYEIWRDKLPWRLSARGFRGPIRDMLVEVLDGPDPDPGLRRLYDMFFVFDQARLDILAECRARFDLRLDFDQLVAEQLS
ncbi:glycosyltransferase family 2 protein [Pseudooceanicola sp.]|uniref:glycosyltransferase family 2 protein n=1 Tax=Pseudooceanicola sp. TaxID=1914328 RepID=UPI0035C666E4